jgi:hypothetical protein
MQFSHLKIVFLLLIFHISLYSQDLIKTDLVWQNDLKKAYLSSLDTKTIEPLQSYLDSNIEKYQGNLDFNKMYYSYRIAYFRKVDKPRLRKKTREEKLQDKALLRYIEDIKEYREACIKCSLCALIDQYETYQALKLDSYFPPADKDAIFSKGYKQSKEGPAFNVKYIGGDRSYIGAEFSFKAIHSPAYVVKDIDPSTNKLAKLCRSPVNMIALSPSFGFNYNPSDKHKQAVFNLLSLNTPLFVKPTQVGLEFTPQKNLFFYRPELGFGYNGFTVSVGYNVVFSKDLRSHMDRWALTLGYTFVKDAK